MDGGGLPSVTLECTVQNLPLVNVLSVLLIRGGRESPRTGGRPLTASLCFLTKKEDTSPPISMGTCPKTPSECLKCGQYRTCIYYVCSYTYTHTFSLKRSALRLLLGIFTLLASM